MDTILWSLFLLCLVSFSSPRWPWIVCMCLCVGLWHLRDEPSLRSARCASPQDPARDKEGWIASLNCVEAKMKSVFCFLGLLEVHISCSCNALWFVESAVSCLFVLRLGFLFAGLSGQNEAFERCSLIPEQLTSKSKFLCKRGTLLCWK